MSTTKKINWKVTKADAATIRKIVERSEKASDDRGWPRIHGLDMDLTACHANGCRLDLAGLLAADDFNFAHDIAGIHANLDRSSGRLTNHFVPRYAAHSRATGGAS